MASFSQNSQSVNSRPAQISSETASLLQAPSIAVTSRVGFPHERKVVLDSQKQETLKFPDSFPGFYPDHNAPTKIGPLDHAPILRTLNLQQVQKIVRQLQQSGIEAAYLPSTRKMGYKILIAADYRSVAWGVLESLFPEAQLATGPAGESEFTTPLRRSESNPPGQATLTADLDGCWLLFPKSESAAGRQKQRTQLYNRVWVEFWYLDDSEGGYFYSPLRQESVQRIAQLKWNRAQFSGSSNLAPSSYPNLFKTSFDIDVVYTWVDDSDPAWVASKNRTLADRPHTEQKLREDVRDTARFRSHDELKYSLRSLEMFAPWVRNIFIVTAGQVPDWLKTDHPQIQLVDHREIFADPSALPSFNSHAIESQLHRIPGLSEHYLYLNDDLLFGREVSPELFFFSNGIAKFFPSDAMIDDSHEVSQLPGIHAAARNNQSFMRRHFGKDVQHLFKHTPQPQRKSVLVQLEREHPEIFSEVQAARFRQVTDYSIASALHHHVAYAQGKALPGEIDYLYLDLAHPHLADWFDFLFIERNFDVLCINDTPMSAVHHEHASTQLQSFLERYFPMPSRFEREENLSPHLELSQHDTPEESLGFSDQRLVA